RSSWAPPSHSSGRRSSWSGSQAASVTCRHEPTPNGGGSAAHGSEYTTPLCARGRGRAGVMKRTAVVRRIAAGSFLALLTLAMLSPAAAAAELPEGETAAPPPPPPEDHWFHLGALRIRDLTPFGILRLDFLPAHAVTAKPGTWAFEVNLSYQNTYVLSQNVQDYLEAKGGGHRVYLDDTDVAHFI